MANPLVASSSGAAVPATVETPASEALKRSEPGRVQSVFCRDVDLARRRLRVAAEEEKSIPTLVALEWERVPSLARELDEIRDALAEAAGSIWPNWYITAEERFERTRPRELDLSPLIAEIAQSAGKVSTSWLREAWKRCRNGNPPVVAHMAAGEQVRQLSRALDPGRLVFVLSVLSDDAPPARLRGLAGAAEWLAYEAQARTLLLLPGSWQGNPELDRVAYGAVTLDEDEVATPRVPAIEPLEPPGNVNPSEEASRESELTKRVGEAPVHVLVGPVVGKPHPGSEVEQLLNKRLSSDHDLGALFEYNQRLAAFGGNQYIVNLVWKQGGLVVELDGPEHHGHLTYVKDRERDYRLYMSGYTTLRVTNDEVCIDVERVVTKIKNMVGRLKAHQKGKVSDDLRT